MSDVHGNESFDRVFGGDDGMANLMDILSGPDQDTPPTEPAPNTPEDTSPNSVPEETPAEGSTVPYAALHAEREKRKAETAARETAERALEELRGTGSQPANVAPPAPTSRDDIDTKGMSAEQIFALNNINQKLGVSEMLAREKFGDDVVNKVETWARERFEKEPGWAATVFNQTHPYKFAIEQFEASERAKAAGELTPEQIAEAIALYRAKDNPPGDTPPQPMTLATALVSPPAPQALKRPAPPPSSLAESPAAKGTSPTNTPVGDGQAFATFAQALPT